MLFPSFRDEVLKVTLSLFLKVSFRLEFEFNRSMVLDYVRIILHANRW